MAYGEWCRNRLPVVTSVRRKKPYLKGFRAYLYPYSDYNGTLLQTTSAKEDLSSYWLTGAEVCGDSYGGGTTGIEQLVEAVNTMMTAGHKGVYNASGADGQEQ